MSRKKPSLIGIDITDNAVRLVEMISIKQSPFIKSCVKVEYDTMDALNGNSLKPMLYALDQALKQVETFPKEIIFAVPDSLTHIKTARVDATLTDDEIYLWVNQEAPKYLRTASEALALDFEILKQIDGKKYVRWVAIKQKDMMTQTELFKKINLSIKIVDIYSLAFERISLLAIQKLNIKKNCVGTVYFDKKMLIFNVLKNIEIVYTATEAYQINTYQVDQKNENSIETANALKRAINIFLLSLPNEQISHLLLSGSGFCFHTIQKDIMASIQYLDIFTLFPSSVDFPKSICEISYEFALCAGLAMRISDEY